MNKILLITSDLSPGGAEKVMSLLANNFVKNAEIEVHLACLVRGNFFYSIDQNVSLHIPDFNYKKYPKLIAYIKTFFYIRTIIKSVKPSSYLSFGGRYNSLCIMAGLGLKSKAFISDRSRPGISYGKFLDFLNKRFYPFSYGIIAQTEKAKEVHLEKFKHNNISVIGNPIPDLYDSSIERKNVILNVGRFISSKNQSFLIDIFSELNLHDWELWFLGDGDLKEECIHKASASNLKNQIKFFGNVKDVKYFYNSCSIFAFTSSSEGFPNSLGEALSAGLACISFDCSAGPSDLIVHGENGFLTQVLNKEEFKKYLFELVSDLNLRRKFSMNSARKIVENYSESVIVNKYYDFLK